MPKKPNTLGDKGRAAMSLPTPGIGTGFMPNFGIDIPMNLNMKPALSHPGAPARPGNPDKKGRKHVSGVGTGPKNSPPQGTSNSPTRVAPLALNTPPAFGKKSKAGIPPPPSHGTRNKASFSGVKLNSLPGTQSPSLLKPKPLPKITKNTSQKKTENNKQLTEVELVLFGYISDDLPALPGRLVRVFLSSTFSDMKAERNKIWSSVYPAVRSHSLSRGLEFSFVDMRWGVLDYATDHHRTEEIVLNEVSRTIKISAATSFVSIIGHRYGSVVNENKLTCKKFEILIAAAEKHNLPHKDLLTQWYKPDLNNIPPVHVLQPISMMLPDYLSTDSDKKAAATDEWNTISDKLWKVKYAATKLAVEGGDLPESELEQMEKSVTTTEIEAGITTNPLAPSTTFGIYRKFDGIEADVEDPSTSRFIDVIVEDGKTVVNKANLEKIEKFVAQPISKVIKSGARKMYSVPWNSGGIPTDVSKQSPTDKEFLDTLSSDLITFLTNQIEAHLASLENEPTEYRLTSDFPFQQPTSVEEKKHVCTPECLMKCALANKLALIEDYKSMETNTIMLPVADYKEVLHQLRLAEIKTRGFSGRKQQLQEVKKYLGHTNYGAPLMVHGASGGGKTPFAGQVAKLVHTDNWLGPRAVVVLRFLGSTVACEQVQTMLRGVLRQISCVYQVPIRLQSRESVKQLGAKLLSLLNTTSVMCLRKNMPLVIILDGLEHLNKSANSHNLTWIPQKLPPLTYLITTFNAETPNLLSTAQGRFERFLELPPLTLDDMMDFLDVTLKVNNRTLTPQQRDCVEKNLKLYPYPVYAQLLSQLALETPSTMDISSKLSSNTEDTVSAFLNVLEQRYGEKFVSYALSYITCGHMGISEIELEDVLSCSDEVLIEVYVYHGPPIPGTIRLPSHLWPMLRAELDQYLVEKVTNDYTLLTWYHKPIEKAISQRYLSDPEKVKMYHKNLSQLYLSPKGLKRTITLTRLRQPITIEDADRQIAQYTDTDKLPVRILFSIVHHLVAMKCSETLKSMTVCNLKYITAIWRKVDLKYMSTLTSNMIDECKAAGIEDDLELCLMLDFYNNYMPSFNGRKYSAEVELDLCVQILGAFSVNPETPSINALIEKSRTLVTSSQRPLLIPTDDCLLFGQDELKWEISDTSVMSDVEEETSLISVVHKSCKLVDTVDINEQLTYTTNTRNKISSVQVSQRRTFVLTDSLVYIQDCSTKVPTKASVKTDALTKDEHLNRALAVSSSSKLFCLGGKDKIAVFEDKSSSNDSLQYKAISSLNLGGVKSTQAILFTTDEKYTISAHTIAAAKNKHVGGIVKWDYETKTTESRLSLPSPILKSCLYLLPDEDKVVCACDHHEVYLVSLKEQKILQKLYSNKICWLSVSVESCYLTLVLESGEIQVINTADVQTTTFRSANSPLVGCTCSAVSLSFVGNKKGWIECYSLAESQLIKEVHVSSSAITKVRAFSEQLLEVHDSTNEVLVLNIEKMGLPGGKESDKQEVANSLGSTTQGVFSSGAGELLVERSGSESASLYSTSDLTRVDLSVSQGFSNLTLCGKTSYIIGEKNNSLGLWDVAKGAEVIPPPLVKELCDSLVPYYAFPTEPVLLFADGGLVTCWNITSGELGTVPYIGANVNMIKSSGRLVVISLRSGSNDSWLVYLLEKTSGKCLASAEKEEPISDIQCTENSGLFTCNESCYIMTAQEPVAKEVQLSAPVQLISTCGDNYTLVSGGRTVSLVDGSSGSVLVSLAIEAKVSEIVFSTEEYSLISLPLGTIQLIKWQTTHSPASSQLSNKIQTTCSHLAASIDTQKHVLYVYGRLLDESRIFTFDMQNI